MARSTTVMIQIMTTVQEYLKVADIPVQQVLTFAIVADRTEVPMQDLPELTGVGQSSVSRNVDRLASGRPNDPGYGLLESYDDPHYRRRKLVRLTARGKELLKRIDAACARYLKSAA